jgi:imidazolonepropionase-like amidohydrolase
MLDAGSYARDRKARQSFLDFYYHGLKLAGDAHHAGVKILAGTDANDTYVFPGFSLHDELAELVWAGLTSLVALQTVTGYAASFFGKMYEFRSVEAGKMAISTSQNHHRQTPLERIFTGLWDRSRDMPSNIPGMVKELK